MKAANQGLWLLDPGRSENIGNNDAKPTSMRSWDKQRCMREPADGHGSGRGAPID